MNEIFSFDKNLNSSIRSVDAAALKVHRDRRMREGEGTKHQQINEIK